MSNCLIGKIITGLKIADDKKAVLFITDHGEIVAMADGDCCSDTWIEHVELPAMGFPATVVSVGELDMPETGGDGEDECIAVYGLKITTDKGEIIVDYRNASNGYYGGNLSWPGEYHYGGVYGQNSSTLQWIDIGRDI